MAILEIQSRVGPDGILVLSVPVGQENANRDVKVIVDAIDQRSSARTMTQEEWAQMIRDTAGSIDDPTFVRPDQGQFETRDIPFP
jgi:hypothetical protein